MISYRKAAVYFIIVAIVFLALGMFFSVNFAPLLENIGSGQLSSYGEYKRLDEIANLVQENYYKETKRSDLFTSAAKGMMSSIGDKYAAYYTAEEYKTIAERMKGDYYGLGILLGVHGDGAFSIIKVYPDSPAQKAGIESGDVLSAVNNVGLKGKSIEDVVTMIKGKKGEKVSLSINRDGRELVVSAACAKVTTQRVSMKMLDKIAYIAIDEFSGNCVEGFITALADAERNEAVGVVIDLRNNPGGSLTDVIQIADMILGEGRIISIRTRDGKEEVIDSDATMLEAPVAVLVNGFSASASEVLAGAIQDHKRGPIVGEKTYGKGIVQTIYDLKNDGGRLKMTTSTYYTPNGRSIHELGIIPDLVVPMPKELQNKLSAELTPQEDVQLQAAIKLLKEKISSSN